MDQTATLITLNGLPLPRSCINGERHDLRKRKGKNETIQRFCHKCGWEPDEKELKVWLNAKGGGGNTVVLPRPGAAANPNQRRALKLIELYGDVCAYCKDALDDISRTLDHYIPATKGGTFDLGNLRLACRLCNILKKDLPGPVWDLAREKNLCQRCIKLLATNRPLACCVNKWEN